MLLVLLFFAFAASGSCDDSELSWPEKYSFEITKYCVSSGLVEDIKIWRTKSESRLEYNHGAVKTFVTSGSKHEARGYRYEIHPETHSGDDPNEITCNVMRRSRFDEGPADILPQAFLFEKIGEEKMHDVDTIKFYTEEQEDSIQSKHTIWAYKDSKSKAFIPVKYELEAFDTRLGSIDRHDIWVYENFNNEFDEKEIFNAKKYCKVSDPIRHKMNNESVTKHLMFIDPENEKHVDHVFKTFKKKFSKIYDSDLEHTTRRNILRRNMRLIQTTNRKNLGYKLSVNKFADLTPEELKRHMGYLPRPKGKVGTHPFPYRKEKLEEAAKSVPSAYDLRLDGLISPVQNQETCGSCYTFGTTSAMEGALARANGGRMIRLSNQALIDCSWEFGNNGCDGGTDNAAYEWMAKYGMPTIADYGEYENRNGYCHINNVTTTYKIKGFVDVTPNSVDALKVSVVKHGPLSVSVHVTSAFILYDGGVFYDFEWYFLIPSLSEPTNLNHEITLVGYGEQYGETFWIVKNSWGPEWGIDGFMHIAAKDNNCGIMTEPTYVFI